MHDPPLTKREQAEQMLHGLLKKRDRVTIAEAVEAGQKLGVSRSTVARAAKNLGLREVHNGPYPGIWERPS